MAERIERCETCRFWKRLSTGDLYRREEDLIVEEKDGSDPPILQCWIGYCKRHPPIISGSLENDLNMQRLRECVENYNAFKASRCPLSSDDDWCGEWQPTPPAAATKAAAE